LAHNAFGEHPPLFVRHSLISICEIFSKKKRKGKKKKRKEKKRKEKKMEIK